MNIPDIGVAGVSIPDVGIYLPPVRRELLMPSLPPGVSMALPVIQIPGCVEAHVDSDLQTELTTSDPSQVRIYCDAGMPAFDPMAYQPYLQQVDKQPAIPKFANAAAEPKAEAPVSKSRRQETTKSEEKGRQSLQSKPQCEEGEVLRQGECIKIERPEPQEFTIGGKYLPPLESVTTTAAIATTATVSALLARPIADWLLKLIKPAIKKIIAKIKKMLGKSVPIRSVRQRVLAQRLRNQALRQARDLMG